jgi:hypothetical protein
MTTDEAMTAEVYRRMGGHAVHDRVSALLFTLHEQAMDASADPNHDTIRALQKTWKAISQNLPSLYSERYANQMAAQRGEQ